VFGNAKDYPAALFEAVDADSASSATIATPLMCISVESGSDELNGLYFADPGSEMTFERLRWTKCVTPLAVGSYELKPNEKVRLFRCHVQNEIVWYISATGPKSGTDKDVDFYEFSVRRRNNHHLSPPPSGWLPSCNTNQAGRNLRYVKGSAFVRRGPLWQRIIDATSAFSSQSTELFGSSSSMSTMSSSSHRSSLGGHHYSSGHGGADTFPDMHIGLGPVGRRPSSDFDSSDDNSYSGDAIEMI
jgi:hypothetical protein